MTPTRTESWAVARVLSDQPLNGELQAASKPIKRLVDHLETLPVEGRLAAFQAFACAYDDADRIIRAVAAADPASGPPEGETVGRCATLADIRSLVADTQWPWPGWLVAGALNALAADPGTGKTVMAADLARRLWFGEAWPDGQANPLPSGTRTLWVPGDRHYVQLIDLASKYGLPDESMLLNATRSDPTAGLDLDDPVELAALGARIRGEKPGVVVIDTVGMSTARNLCKPEDARAYFGPLMDLAGETGVPILLLTHLSKGAEALGRRIVGACRTVWKMTHPDPEGQPDRRRLWVDKTYAMKPPHLGVSIADDGCSFDFDPPSAPESEPRRPGPAPAKLEKAKAWLADRLESPSRVRDVRSDAETAGYSADTLYRARAALGAEEYTLEGRKWWKLPAAAAD